MTFLLLRAGPEGRSSRACNAKGISQGLTLLSRWWERLAAGFAESYAERAGFLDACRERGIQDLLRVRSVQMAIGASLSLIYAQTFEGRKPKPSDSRDILHAAAAAATTDMLVTHDQEFARLLPRISVPDFRVGTLHDLLQQIP